MSGVTPTALILYHWNHWTIYADWNRWGDNRRQGFEMRRRYCLWIHLEKLRNKEGRISVRAISKQSQWQLGTTYRSSTSRAMFEFGRCSNWWLGRAIAQAVSRWLPTAVTRVWSSGICSGQSGTGAGFLRVLRFPLPIFIPPNSQSS
jgi:hypothetical protein